VMSVDSGYMDQACVWCRVDILLLDVEVCIF
jgi:hypothetical protein